MAQIAWSHHLIEADGWLLRQSVPYRYVWPSELDLMAKIIRFPGPGPDRTLFTSASRSQVVFEKLS
jgi:hypothetical protein